MSRVQEQQQFREVEGLWHRSGLSCNSGNETFPLQQCQSPLRVNCFWCHCHGTWFCPCLSLTCGQQWLGCFPHPSNWIKERTACLCPSSELWLIWLITIYIDYISNRVCVTCHIQVPLLHHLIIYFLCLQNQKCRSLSCPRGCHQTSQPWIWLWLNAAMNTEEIQLCSLSEAINTVYHKKIIVTGGNKEFGKTYALQNAFVPWPKSSTYVISKDKTADSPGTFQDLCKNYLSRFKHCSTSLVFFCTTPSLASRLNKIYSSHCLMQ